MSIEIPPRKGRPVDPAKRDAIIAAAVRAFFEMGFAAASIEQIAADAGVSKVTVYNQFGDKRGLFAAAVETECNRLQTLFSIDPTVGATLRDRLRNIGTGMVTFLSRPEMIQFERRIAAETVLEPEIGAAFLAAGPHRMKTAFAAFLRATAEAQRRGAGDEHAEARRQVEAREVGIQPGRVGFGKARDAGHAKLLALAIQRVHGIARGVGVGMRRAARDAGPFGAGADQPAVAGGARGGLEVVHAREAGAAQARGQPQQRGRIAPAGAAFRPDLVEPGAAPGEIGIGRRGEQRDARGGVVGADGGEGAEGLHHVAERAEADDEDGHGRSSR
ncbi:TetR/AcrR family transcriptional regulator [Leptolyngbya sp. 15MV]|nr:TetR/AcrR family transcriptional regulator [Leptolyngbya sp. 15MV]